MNDQIELTKRFNEECEAMYGSDWSKERGALIIKRLDPPIDPERVIKALRRYMKYHRFMPNLADINQQMEEIEKEDVRRKKEEHFQARQQESDAAYEQFSSGVGLTGRAKYWHERMKQEISLSTQYRSYLAIEYGLDYSKPAHNRFLIGLIDRARTTDGFLLPLEQAKQVAAQMIAEYRAEKAKNGPPARDRHPGPVHSSPHPSISL